MSFIFRRNTPYIDKEYYKVVKAHSYVGEELSIVYNYFYAPLCSWLVTKLPMWVAPNLISFTGQLLIDMFYIMSLCISGYKIGVEHPAWFLYLISFGYIFYHILDNLDGKQARRTGSSSPLGMLIDHGVDALTAVFFS